MVRLAARRERAPARDSPGSRPPNLSPAERKAPRCEHGGFFWEADVATGAPNKPNKHLYGQAFAIYALAQYGVTLKSEAALGLATSTSALLERQAHDTELGGYREWFSPDWQAARGPGYLGWEARFKLVNTHLHLLEAFTGLVAAAPAGLLRNRVAELIEILSARTVHPRFGVALDCRLENWAPLRKRRNNRVSYGHDLEAIYLLRGACAAIGADRDAIVEHFRLRFAYCMRFGFDYENGGFFDHGPLGHGAKSTTKIWWVQAEALLSALTMYRLTLERPYLAVFERTLGWIQSAQIDWQGGEWHRHIEPDGRPSGAKFDRWKCPYHNGRAVLECIGLIDELL
jgi:mannobiose 2-epimerase